MINDFKNQTGESDVVWWPEEASRISNTEGRPIIRWSKQSKNLGVTIVAES